MLKRRLIIAIDCDDVIVATAEGVIKNYNQQYHTHLGLSDMYTPATLDVWGTDSDDVAIERVNDYIRSDTYAQQIPSKDTVGAINQLAKQHELHLVTGRPDFLEMVTKTMLETYFPGCFQSVEHTNFIVASTSTAKKRTKGEVCAQIGADVLIDDHIIHGESVMEAGLQEVIVFGDYPWNQREQLPAGMVRCADWQATVREIEKIANK